ncbi:hypothetical protein CBL_06941 [Carabus blaptoides fortunei]
MAYTGLVTPVVYDGSLCWEQWLVLYEIVADMNRWTDDPAKMANMLIVSLRGDALSLSLTLDEDVRKDYVALKGKLNETLCPKSMWMSILNSTCISSTAKCITGIWRSVCELYQWEDGTTADLSSALVELNSKLPTCKIKRRRRKRKRQT